MRTFLLKYIVHVHILCIYIYNTCFLSAFLACSYTQTTSKGTCHYHTRQSVMNVVTVEVNTPFFSDFSRNLLFVMSRVHKTMQACCFSIMVGWGGAGWGRVRWWANNVGLRLHTHLMLPACSPLAFAHLLHAALLQVHLSSHSHLMLPYLKFTCIPQLFDRRKFRS